MFFTSIFRWKHKAALVFDDSVPASWTDLDLSSVVGKRHALVMLKIEYTAGNPTAMYFRTNGETQEVAGDAEHAAGNNIIYMSSDKICNLVLETDANGIIEWYVVFGTSAKIYVMGFV